MLVFPSLFYTSTREVPTLLYISSLKRHPFRAEPPIIGIAPLRVHYTRPEQSVSMGLTVSRQMAKHLTVNRQKKTIFTINRQKSTYTEPAVKRLQDLVFQLLISAVGSQRMVLIGTTSFHFPKYTHFPVFSTNLRLNRHYIWECFRFQNIND